MSLATLTTRDDFEHWLASLDDFLEAFIASVPPNYREKLDYSPASLDIVESLILAKYSDTKSMLHCDESLFVNRAAVYIGETFRKAIGGQWDIRLDNPKFAFYALPILVHGGSRQNFIDCPLTLATASADRRTGIFLRTLLENNK